MIFSRGKNSVEICWSDDVISCSFAGDEAIVFCVRDLPRVELLLYSCSFCISDAS